jgi:GDP-L-fucose synthase
LASAIHPRNFKGLIVIEGKRVWVAGHNGMVGSAIMRRLASECCELLTVDRATCDLTDPAQVREWMTDHRPEQVVIAAAKVGGILANDTYPVDFLLDNLLIQNNIISSAYHLGVEKLLFLGSSCIYPRMAPQPITEDALLTGPLEPTNEWYAIAKIAGIKLCQAYMKQYGARFISAMPTNLYGPHDNFDLNSSHVIPALLRKAHRAKLEGEDGIEIWGTGEPLREFLHVDDLADAAVFVLKTYEDYEHINIGSGTDLPIAEVAQMVMDVVGLKGELRHDRTKPDGTPRKLMSADKLRAMGWAPKIPLHEGLSQTYQWFVENVEP